MSRNNIIICSGGSGGHIFPALSVYNEIKKNDRNNVIFLTDTRGASFIKKIDSSIDFITFPTIKASFKYTFSIFKTILDSFKIFLEHKPDLIICFGGIFTVIPALLARLLKIKIVIHEQNAILGKANKFIIKCASPDKIMLSFKKTLLIDKKSNYIYAGYPLLRVNTNNHERTFTSEKTTILILAGSQGSYLFDQILPNILIKVVSKISDKQFTIVQQSKKENIQQISELYYKNNIKHFVSDFFNDTNELMQTSDLMISRGGAGTIFEILEYKIPSIIIPLKNSADNHQKLNSKYFHDYIDIVEEDNIGNLQKKLISIFDKPNILCEKYNKLQNIKLENALQYISELINREFDHVNQ